MRDPQLKKVRPVQKRAKRPERPLRDGQRLLRRGRPADLLQADDLGSYLLYTSSGQFLTTTGTQAQPSPATVWTADEAGPRATRLTNQGTSRVLQARR